MFQNRISESHGKKKKILQSLFLNEGKNITKHQLESLAACTVSRSHNFQTCLDKNRSQNREAQHSLYFNAQATFLPGTLSPYSEEFFNI